MPYSRLAKWVALALFLVSAPGFAALTYLQAAYLHGPSILVGLLMAVCTGAFGMLMAPNKDYGADEQRDTRAQHTSNSTTHFKPDV